MHFLHVGDHRHLAALGLQAVQGVHRQLQRLGVEAAKALVDKQRLDFQRARRHRRQAQRQRQRHQERFATRQRVHRAQFIAHLGVHHQQAEHAAATLEPVTAHQLAQLHVGVVHQQVEVVGLGDLAEGVAGGRTDQRIQACPALPLVIGLGDVLGQYMVGLLAALVFGLARTQFRAGFQRQPIAD